MSEPRIIELDPQVWYRGQGYEGSELLRDDGRSCCLGIAALSLGAQPERLLHAKTVYHTEGAAMLRHLADDVLAALYRINDNHLGAYRDDESRVEALNRVLREARANFRFALRAVSPSQAG